MSEILTFTTNFPGIKLNEAKYKDLRFNDFDSFWDFLFLNGERRDFSKFGFRTSNDCHVLNGQKAIYVPFLHPANNIEFQVNHFVLWMTIGHFKWTEKPYYIVSLNGKSTFKMSSAVDLSCYACEFCDGYCEECPIQWIEGEDNVEFACEEKGSLYNRWCAMQDLVELFDDPTAPDEAQDTAWAIACKEWKEF